MSENHVISTPRNVDIAITGKCNLACAYCFYADEMVARGNLPTERWLSFFDELGRLGVMTACLTGGEIFTRRDLFDLIDGLITNRMRYQLVTNATLVDESILASLDVGKRRQRLDSIQVSVDGSRAEIHDKSRPNSFTRTLRGLKLLKEAGLPVSVRVTVNHYNVDDLEDIARLLLDEIGLPEFSTNEAYACGATNRFEARIMLTPAQRLQAMRILADLAERYEGRVSAQAGPLALAQEDKAIRQALAQGQTGFPGRGTLCACGGVFSKIAVLHDGTIVPCHNLSTLSLGRIGEDDVGQIWREHPTMAALRQRYNVPLSTLSTCQDCTYRDFCSGGCPGGSLYHTGDLNSRNPLDCHRILMGEEEFFPVGIENESRSEGDQIG